MAKGLARKPRKASDKDRDILKEGPCDDIVYVGGNGVARFIFCVLDGEELQWSVEVVVEVGDFRVEVERGVGLEVKDVSGNLGSTNAAAGI